MKGHVLQRAYSDLRGQARREVGALVRRGGRAGGNENDGRGRGANWPASRWRTKRNSNVRRKARDRKLPKRSFDYKVGAVWLAFEVRGFVVEVKKG